MSVDGRIGLSRCALATSFSSTSASSSSTAVSEAGENALAGLGERESGGALASASSVWEVAFRLLSAIPNKKS